MAISEQDLPSNWMGLGETGKLNWFKDHNYTVQDLLDAGWIEPHEVDWFLDKGLKLESAPPAPAAVSYTHLTLPTKRIV